MKFLDVCSSDSKFFLYAQYQESVQCLLEYASLTSTHIRHWETREAYNKYKPPEALTRYV